LNRLNDNFILLNKIYFVRYNWSGHTFKKRTLSCHSSPFDVCVRKWTQIWVNSSGSWCLCTLINGIDVTCKFFIDKLYQEPYIDNKCCNYESERIISPTSLFTCACLLWIWNLLLSSTVFDCILKPHTHVWYLIDIFNEFLIVVIIWKKQ